MTKILLYLLCFCKKACLFYLKRLPNQDAYCIVYCIIADTATHLDEAIKELPEEIEFARKELENNPNQMPSRAVDWLSYPED